MKQDNLGTQRMISLSFLVIFKLIFIGVELLYNAV